MFNVDTMGRIWGKRKLNKFCCIWPLKKENQKFSRCALRYPKHSEFGHCTLLFCRGRQRNVQSSAELLFFSLTLLINDVFVAVAVVVCLMALLTDGLTSRRVIEQTDRQAGRQTYWKRNRHTDRQKDRLTDMKTKKNSFRVLHSVEAFKVLKFSWRCNSPISIYWYSASNNRPQHEAPGNKL